MRTLRRVFAAILLAVPTAISNTATAQEAGTTAAAAAAAQDPAGPSVRVLLEKWVEVRRQISVARADWRVEKESIEERIDVVRRSIEAVQKRIVETDQSIAAAGEQKAKLAEDGKQLETVAAKVDAALAMFEDRTRALLARLPEPIREKVAPMSQQFAVAATEDGRKKLSLGARLGNVLVVLNLVHKWNREITVTSEIRTLADGSKAEVACLYLGLGQAFYVTAKGDAAGVGIATADGFQWSPRNDAAAAVQEAIAVYQSKKTASFVALPVQIQ